MPTVRRVELTAAFVAEATGGRLEFGPSDRVFDGLSIDSRQVAPGALFVALRGAHADGHQFVGDAIARGATGVLVDSTVADPRGAAVVRVPDTLVALQQLGRRVREASNAVVVAITGSAGKTTTKEVAADLLSTRYRVFRSHGNFNNHIGLPLSLVELRKGPEVAVVELGMNHRGEIRQLVDLARPQIRVWMNVGDAHIGHFGSREAVAEAKAEILEGATAETVVVANADDPLVMAHASRFPGHVLTFGEAARADVRAERVVDLGFGGCRADIVTPEGRAHLEVPLPGRVHLSNVLAGVAVAIELAVPLARIVPAVLQLRAVERRGVVIPLANGARLVDDSYNASPAAMTAALAALSATPTEGRRIAVLGEMLELGDDARVLHERCGHAAAETAVDWLIVVGGAGAVGLADGASLGGFPEERLHRFADAASAAAFVAALIGPGDLVLVKGSRATRTDIVADRLREVA